MSSLLTIVCLTFNHAPYIRKCLEGFVSQQTNFAFDVVIHDDHSVDGTDDIIREYERKYPNIFRPIYEEENMYSKIGFSGIDRIVNSHIHAKYIALCEGDDYWDDPYKLQKQVDFLEKNTDYAMVYTQAIVLNETTQKTKKAWAGETSFKDMLLELNRVVTPTVVYRYSLYSKYITTIQPKKEWKMGDYPLWLFLFKTSKVKFLDCQTVVYRYLDQSASHTKDIKKAINFVMSTYDVRCHIDNVLCNRQYNRQIKIKAINDLFDCSKKYRKSLGKYIFMFAKKQGVVNLRLLLKIVYYFFMVKFPSVSS